MPPIYVKNGSHLRLFNSLQRGSQKEREPNANFRLSQFVIVSS